MSKKCMLTWRVWRTEFPDFPDPDCRERPGDGKLIRTRSAKSAAKKYPLLEEYSLDKPSFHDGLEMRLCVQEATGGRVQVFDVRGEAVPRYTAERVRLGRRPPPTPA